MNEFHEGLVFHDAGATVDFSALLAGVRSLKPRCAECDGQLADSITENRVRLTDAGEEEHLCNACGLSEIGESLMDALPH